MKGHFQVSPGSSGGGKAQARSPSYHPQAIQPGPFSAPPSYPAFSSLSCLMALVHPLLLDTHVGPHRIALRTSDCSPNTLIPQPGVLVPSRKTRKWWGYGSAHVGKEIYKPVGKAELGHMLFHNTAGDELRAPLHARQVLCY